MKGTIAFILAATAASHAQQFQNLNFESATLSPTPPGTGGPVPVAQGLPDWGVFLGIVQQSQVLQNITYNTLASVDILGPNWASFPATLNGNYSVYLQSGYEGTLVSASIAQNGMVPLGSESLQFKAWQAFGQNLTVTFEGDNLPLTVLSTATAPSGQPYDVFGANIAQYDGQTGPLEFTEASGASLLLDDITFSTSSVPEPNSVILTGIGGLLFAAYRRFIKRPQTRKLPEISFLSSDLKTSPSRPLRPLRETSGSRSPA